MKAVHHPLERRIEKFGSQYHAEGDGQCGPPVGFGSEDHASPEGRRSEKELGSEAGLTLRRMANSGSGVRGATGEGEIFHLPKFQPGRATDSIEFGTAF